MFSLMSRRTAATAARSTLRPCTCSLPSSSAFLSFTSSKGPSALPFTVSLFSRSYASKKKSKGGPSPVSPSTKGSKTMTDEGKSAADDPDLGYDLSLFTPAMDDAVDRLQVALKALVGRVGPVSPELLTGLRVQHEGDKSPLSALASVSVSSPSTLLVSPFDPSYFASIQSAIYASPLNLAPQPTDTGALRVPVPKPDLAKRDAWAKEAASLAESAKVAVRGERTKGVKALKADVDSKLVTKEVARADTKDLDTASKKRTDAIDAVHDKAKKMLLDN